MILALRAGVLRAAEALLVPASALAGALVLFGVFVWFEGKDPLEVYALLYRGGFGSSFSWQNTLSRAALLILTALCVALPAQVGLDGDRRRRRAGSWRVSCCRRWCGIKRHLAVARVHRHVPFWHDRRRPLDHAGRCPSHYRGVNETISSLLLTYIALALFNHLVEGPLRDPASLNKPSTLPVGEINMLGNLPGLHVHWGLGFGVIACVTCAIWMYRTTSGFAIRMVGGNPRGRAIGGPCERTVDPRCMRSRRRCSGTCRRCRSRCGPRCCERITNCRLWLRGHSCGIYRASKSLGIIPVALLVGGISASGGMLQRRLDMPDASVAVLEGIAFILILASESWSGKLSLFKFAAAQPALAPRATDQTAATEAAS